MADKEDAKVCLDDVENSLLGFDKSIGDFITQEELDILVRFYIKVQKVKDIASELKIPTGTVTGRLSDARKKLKERFETMENEKNEPEEKKINPVEKKSL